MAGQKGFCGAGSAAEVFRAASHHGEEPPVSGTEGSGTVFFSRCTLKCIYCQNYPWSQNGEGDIYTASKLQQVFEGLAKKGCHNWNLVSPTPWLPLIRPAIEGARDSGRSLPVVYNSSGFEKAETLEEFRDISDVYLLDLRYAKADSAEEGSCCGEYPDIARLAISKAWELVGPLTCDESGIAQKGVICRILVLPGKSGEAIENLRWLADTFGSAMAVSVMSQYTPAYKAVDGDWARKLERAEYEAVTAEVEKLDFDLGWVQDLDGCSPDELVGFRMNEGIS
jgi:putative pyruvate formate lyase activating enzyme